ncbi:MAG: sulfite exporter TauE/SafE family protein [Bacteroidota bacterium]
MEIIFTGFLLGLMGSFHCAGMCGPIALSLPLRGNTFGEKLLSGMLYNLGRTLMYGIMGAIFGLIGQGMYLLGFQRWVSIIMGALMIFSVLLPMVFKKMEFSKFDFFTGFLRRGLQKLFTFRSYAAMFFIGMLNSLLPCGLVYMAIIGAVAIGNIWYGSLYLILFGLGTLPMMLAISLIGNAITANVRSMLNKIVPYIVILVGVIFIFRGMCLGIPYLSPSKENLEQTIFIKHKPTQEMPTEAPCCHKK